MQYDITCGLDKALKLEPVNVKAFGVAALYREVPADGAFVKAIVNLLSPLTGSVPGVELEQAETQLVSLLTSVAV